MSSSHRFHERTTHQPPTINHETIPSCNLHAQTLFLTGKENCGFVDKAHGPPGHYDVSIFSPHKSHTDTGSHSTQQQQQQQQLLLTTMSNKDTQDTDEGASPQPQQLTRAKSLTRTLSETLFGFRRGNKRSRDESDDCESRSASTNNVDADTSDLQGATSDIENQPPVKRQRQLTEEEQKEQEEKLKEFNRKEKEYDSLLKPEYRKWRPKGYKLTPPPTDRPVRIYADGVFDLFHLGHMRQLEQCKKAFPNVELVVGIPNDKETHKRKGLTVLTDKQRYETVRHCKWVDEVVEDAPWILDMKFLKDHKIDYCAHDDMPYVADGIDDIYLPMKQAGMFIATQRTEGISTSDIITKIIRDYDKYLLRNFARGATRQELNVSWLKKNELDLKKHVQDFKKSWKQTNDNLSHMTKDLYVLVRESLIKNSNAIGNNKDSRSPVDRFASKYIGNGLTQLNNKKGLFNNLMDWVGLQPENDSTDETDDTTVPTRSVSPNIEQTPEPVTPKVQKQKLMPAPKQTPKRTSKQTPKKTPKLHAKNNIVASSPKKTPRKQQTPKKTPKKLKTSSTPSSKSE